MRKRIFPIAHSHCTDTFIAVARPVAADETITAERMNPFFQWRINAIPIHFLRQHDRKLLAKPQQAERASPFPTGDRWPQRRANSRYLIAVVRALIQTLGRQSCLLPLTGEPMGCGAKLSVALTLRETSRFPPHLRHRATAICVSVGAPMRL